MIIPQQQHHRFRPRPRQGPRVHEESRIVPVPTCALSNHHGRLSKGGGGALVMLPVASVQWSVTMELRQCSATVRLSDWG
jgi:hypothetical protein